MTEGMQQLTYSTINCESCKTSATLSITYNQQSSSELRGHIKFVVGCVVDTLKSQEASIRIGGMKAGWGGEDWLSTLIPRLSRICKHMFTVSKKNKKQKKKQKKTQHQHKMLHMVFLFCLLVLPWPACARAHKDRRKPWHGFWGIGCCWHLPGCPKSSSTGQRLNQHANRSKSHLRWCWRHQPDTHYCLHGQRKGERGRERVWGGFG